MEVGLAPVPALGRHLGLTHLDVERVLDEEVHFRFCTLRTRRNTTPSHAGGGQIVAAHATRAGLAALCAHSYIRRTANPTHARIYMHTYYLSPCPLSSPLSRRRHIRPCMPAPSCVFAMRTASQPVNLDTLPPCTAQHSTDQLYIYIAACRASNRWPTYGRPPNASTYYPRVRSRHDACTRLLVAFELQYATRNAHPAEVQQRRRLRGVA